MRFHANANRAILSLSFTLFLTACGAENQTVSEAKAVPTPCGVTPACDLAPILGQPEGFLTANPEGDAWHHGKDQYLNENDKQWVIAKFQYGNYFFRKPLVHEKVEIQLSRGCGNGWEVLGEAITTAKGEHPEVNRYIDDGGMIYFQIPNEKKLELGRHRIRLVVRGDQSSTDLFLEVLPAGTQLYVSDVDGTLTKSELIEGLASVFNTLPPAHDGAATALQSLAKKGYRPLYLTARSSNLYQRTRDFLSSKKFPQGMVQTSSATTLGLSGAKGVAYKTQVLQDLEDRGFVISYAFGNSKVDAEAFSNANIPDSKKFFFDFDGFDAFGGGAEFKSYVNLAEVAMAENLCQ